MNERLVRLINPATHRYLTIDDRILRTVDQKQALVVSKEVGQHLLKKVNRIAEAMAQANGANFIQYQLERVELADIELGSDDLDVLIETAQLLGCSYQHAANLIKRQKIRHADHLALQQYYGLSIPHKIK
ncbi:hypothetical protein ACLUYC_04950 [Limosilactobacillus mucosae]